MHFLASWKRALGVDLISYRSQYHIVCIFLPWIRLSNEGCMLSIHCKIALFFYFPLWPVRHFENSSRRACALRGVSGCVHLESRKTNVRRTGERVWYDAWVCVRNCVKRFSFSLFLRLKAGVADTAGTWDTIYIYIERGASPLWICSCLLIWLICHFTHVLLYETSLNTTIHSTTVTQPWEKSHWATYPRNAHSQVISLQVWHFYTIFHVNHSSLTI